MLRRNRLTRLLVLGLSNTRLSILCFSTMALLGTAGLQAQAVFNAQGVRYRVDTVATGLQQPSAMIFLSDVRALVVERRSAKIDILDVKSGSITALDGGFEALIGKDTGVHDAGRPAALTGEDAGLHDIALHPNYANNGWIYITYSSGEAERSTTVVDRFRLRGNSIVDRERIFHRQCLFRRAVSLWGPNGIHRRLSFRNPWRAPSSEPSATVIKRCRQDHSSL